MKTQIIEMIDKHIEKLIKNDWFEKNWCFIWYFQELKQEILDTPEWELILALKELIAFYEEYIQSLTWYLSSHKMLPSEETIEKWEKLRKKIRRIESLPNPPRYTKLTLLSNMCTPSKTELEEFGFIFDPFFNCFRFDVSSNIEINYHNQFRIYIHAETDTSISDLYPQSLDDLKTLIRLLTPLPE